MKYIFCSIFELCYILYADFFSESSGLIEITSKQVVIVTPLSAVIRDPLPVASTTWSQKYSLKLPKSPFLDAALSLILHREVQLKPVSMCSVWSVTTWFPRDSSHFQANKEVHCQTHSLPKKRCAKFRHASAKKEQSIKVNT